MPVQEDIPPLALSVPQLRTSLVVEAMGLKFEVSTSGALRARRCFKSRLSFNVESLSAWDTSKLMGIQK